MMFGIYPIVAEHFEMLFRDMDDQLSNKVRSRNGLGDGFVVFVSGVMIGYIFAIISINAGSRNNRSAEIAGDVFDGDIRSAKIWFCPDIKTIGVFCVHLIFNFQKRWTDTGSEALKKDFAKGVAEKVIIKVFDRAPGSEVASTTFRNECMDMGIPL